ncbi:hypothetical protein NRI_0395 [Neorickettsia risticii str. Illinois]|uniref:Uncharacterized protein n=1 Tax=Neorickettsia risticii (strain Illinois) TaxID=434131 RepID=C6V4R2_NEORI|nr:hypothetical protein NRI_0395 [Neorickettsia risticii str. Illinois]
MESFHSHSKNHSLITEKFSLLAPYKNKPKNSIKKCGET